VNGYQTSRVKQVFHLHNVHTHALSVRQSHFIRNKVHNGDHIISVKLGCENYKKKIKSQTRLLFVVNHLTLPLAHQSARSYPDYSHFVGERPATISVMASSSALPRTMDMKHHVQVSFPAFHLLSVGARVWLPYSALPDNRTHGRIEDRIIESYDPDVFGYEVSLGYPITLPPPRCLFSWNPRGAHNDNDLLHGHMARAVGHAGSTTLEAVAFVADWENANMNDLLDRVVIRIRRCTYWLTGVWQESIYELSLQQFYFSGNPFHDRPTYMDMLDALVWRIGDEERAHVARLTREAGFVEPAIRFELCGPAEEYFAALVPTSITDIDEGDRQCHICKQTYELPGPDSEPEQPTTLSCCGQHVGEDCLRYWFRQVTEIGAPRNTCPFCRANLFLQGPDLRRRRTTARNLLPDLRPQHMTARNLHKFYGIAGEWQEAHANRVRPTPHTGPPGTYSMFSNPDVMYTMQHPPLPTDYDRCYIETFEHFCVIAKRFNDKTIDLNSWNLALSLRSRKVQRMRQRRCNDERTTPKQYPQTLLGVALTSNFLLADRAREFASRKAQGLPGFERHEPSWLGMRYVTERIDRLLSGMSSRESSIGV